MKAKTPISREEAKKNLLASQLKSLPKLGTDEKMKLALQLGCSMKKIERYTSGNATEVRNIQWADVLLNAAKLMIGDAVGA